MFKLVLPSLVAAVMCSSIPNTPDRLRRASKDRGLLEVTYGECYVLEFPDAILNSLKENPEMLASVISSLSSNIANITEDLPVQLIEYSEDHSDERAAVEENCKGKDFFIVTYKPRD